MKKALIIEDDPKLSELISLHMEDLRFSTTTVYDGLKGLSYAMESTFDLIILDLMLPSLDGMEICKQIRSKGDRTPIIMLTAKSEEIDKVLGLETGADDYITKPFSIRELQARIKAVMRRSQSIPHITRLDDKVLTFNQLKIDPDRRIVSKNGVRIELTPKEFDLLILLARNPGKSFNRSDLLNLVWGYDFSGFEHTINSHINRIRAKIENDMTKPQYILTTWGYGYRFNEEL